MQNVKIINLSKPEECFRCKQVRPPIQWTNVAPHAAATGPSLMAPVCEECAIRWPVNQIQPILWPT